MLCVEQTVPTRIEKTADGRLKVFWDCSKNGTEGCDVYDTVLAATGRVPLTSQLNLDAAGVEVDRK